jgi:hypothetical protein
MRAAVYNSAIPDMLNRLLRTAPRPPHLLRILLVLLAFAIAARGADWSGPELQLARKIVAVTGPGAVALTVENRSSLGRRENEAIQNGLRSALEGLGIRFVKADQAAATVAISLSENPTSYVWVAEIHQAAAESGVVMVSAPRPESTIATHESVPLALRKLSLWSQDDPILDVAVLEENAAPTRIAVLEAERVALYRFQAGKWQAEQSLSIAHLRPWPRDLRGRVIPAKDHLLDVYLPGVLCHAALGVPLALNCRESDDPWPLVAAGLSGAAGSVFPGPAAPASGSTSVNVSPMGAFYAATRNFFTGPLTPGIGRFKTVSKFYSAALLPREKYLLWLFTATDGHVHMVDGLSDQATNMNWGSDLASVKTACGAGWQVLATSFDEETGDSLRAYELPDRDPVAVSAAVDFGGSAVMKALWTEAAGGTAVAVVRHRETGSYEAFRLAVACSQ